MCLRHSWEAMCSSAHSTPTGRGNNFLIKQAQFREFCHLVISLSLNASSDVNDTCSMIFIVYQSLCRVAKLGIRAVFGFV